MLEQDLIAILRMRPWWVHPKFFVSLRIFLSVCQNKKKGLLQKMLNSYKYTKKLYKETIWHKTSWKVRNGQLGKFYFPVGKIFFLSWKIIFFQLGTFRSPFWRIFTRFWPLMVIISKYQKSFTFLSLFRHKNKRNIFITLTQISPIPQMLLLFREIREIRVRNNVKH